MKDDDRKPANALELLIKIFKRTGGRFLTVVPSSAMEPDVVSVLTYEGVTDPVVFVAVAIKAGAERVIIRGECATVHLTAIRDEIREIERHQPSANVEEDRLPVPSCGA